MLNQNDTVNLFILIQVQNDVVLAKVFEKKKKKNFKGSTPAENQKQTQNPTGSKD